MPKQIVGSVHWIENGKQTNRLVDVGEAFGDPDQARSQVQFAEASGDKKEIRLVRLAYRQFQGMRYRGESTAKPKKFYGSARSIKDSKVSQSHIKRQDSGRKGRKEDCQEEVVRQEACPYCKWRTILLGRMFRSLRYSWNGIAS